MNKEIYAVRKFVKTLLTLDSVEEVLRFLHHIDKVVIYVIKFLFMLLGINRQREKKNEFIRKKKNQNYMSHSIREYSIYSIDRRFEKVNLPISPRYA